MSITISRACRLHIYPWPLGRAVTSVISANLSPNTGEFLYKLRANGLTISSNAVTVSIVMYL
jgi:hypothetical protein